MSELNLWPESFKEENGKTTISATIERSTGRLKLWFQVPSEYQDLLTTNCDPFVVGVIFIAMAEKSDLVVHGEVSPSLLRNIEEFQAVWSCWRPDRYTAVEIVPDTEKEDVDRRKKMAIAAFSGGVDACFTVFRHSSGLAGRRTQKIDAGVLVHGFDIPLDQGDVFERVILRSKNLLKTLGLKLIPLATNFRGLGGDWEDSHAAGIASSLMIFQGHYGAGLIGSSGPYNGFVIPWGSNPLSDRMLSSKAFEIVHDSAEYTKLEKVRKLAQWPEAIKELRVCWQGEQLDRNCGCCEKCIRTILIFRANGMGLPQCFERDVTDDQILGLTKLTKGQTRELESILGFSRSSGISGSWVDALEKCLSRQNRKDLWTIFKKKVSLRTRLRKLIKS